MRAITTKDYTAFPLIYPTEKIARLLKQQTNKPSGHKNKSKLQIGANSVVQRD